MSSFVFVTTMYSAPWWRPGPVPAPVTGWDKTSGQQLVFATTQQQYKIMATVSAWQLHPRLRGPQAKLPRVSTQAFDAEKRISLAHQ